MERILRRRNLAGTIDDISRRDQLLDLPVILPGLNHAHVLMIALITTLVTQFAMLVRAVEEDQKQPIVTCLGGTPVTTRLIALQGVSSHCELHWTLGHYTQLSDLIARGDSSEAIVAIPQIKQDEFERGYKKIEKSFLELTQKPDCSPQDWITAKANDDRVKLEQ
jgi:hypothetical protein